MNPSWKRMFSSIILARGYDYYISDSVFDVEKYGDRYTALVQGSRDYNVEIEFDGDDVIDMDCDCPYSESGEYCKHEAALLFYLESNKISTMQTIKPSEDIKEIIDSLDSGSLKELLYKAVMSNHELLDELIKKGANSTAKPSFSTLFYRANDFIQEMEEDGYYDYGDYSNKVVDAIYNLDNFLKENVLPLAEQTNYCFDIFKLTSDILDKIPFSFLKEYGYEDDIDDLDSTIADIMDMAYTNAENKNDIEALARDRSEQKTTGQYYLDFLIYTVKDKKIAFKELEELRLRNSSGPFIYPIEEEINLMNVLEYPEEEIREVLKTHLDLSSAQALLARRLLEKDELESCIETIKYINATYGKNNECFRILKDIYVKHGMKEDLIDLIYSDLLNEVQYRMDGVNELRALVSDEEWNDKCNALKNATTMERILPEFLNSIESYPELISWFEKNASIFNLKYGSILLPIFPDRTIAVYKTILENTCLNGRDSYRNHANILEQLLAVESGKEFVISYVGNLLSEFSNRPALKDEMQKMLRRNNLFVGH